MKSAKLFGPFLIVYYSLKNQPRQLPWLPWLPWWWWRPCSRIRDVEAFWYKTEIKNIYFLTLCLILWFTMTLHFWYLKLINSLIFFLRLEADLFWSYFIMQGICNKFIEMRISVGCMVWPWLHLLQHWTFVKYWWDMGNYLGGKCISRYQV